MKYQLVGDSSLDLNEELREKLSVDLVPLHIFVDGQEFIDNDQAKVPEIRKAMKNSKEAVRTGCPSPYDFEKVFDEEADAIFVVTLSKFLSGSYNSASLAAKNFMEKHPNVQVYVFDSLSASSGETRLGLYLDKLFKQGLSFDEIVEKGEAYVQDMRTFFILETLDNFIKNGRIKKTSGLVAKTLKIKPIMRGVQGKVSLYEINRGFKKSLMKMVEAIGKEVAETKGRVLTIAHSNGEEKAEFFKEKVMETYNFDEIHILEMSGLSSAYADDGGIVIAF